MKMDKVKERPGAFPLPRCTVKHNIRELKQTLKLSFGDGANGSYSFLPSSPFSALVKSTTAYVLKVFPEIELHIVPGAGHLYRANLGSRNSCLWCVNSAFVCSKDFDLIIVQATDKFADLQVE